MNHQADRADFVCNPPTIASCADNLVAMIG
jgi:hypothetical protein